MPSIKSLSKRAFAFQNHIYFLSEASIRNINTDSSYGSRFDIRYFKSLTEGGWSRKENIHSLLHYAERFLQPLGEGSSRKAFLYSSKKVLKIAKDDFGMAQNAEEALNGDIEPNQESMDSRISTKLYDKSEQVPAGLFWIIVELVKPLRGAYETNKGLIYSDGTKAEGPEAIKDEMRFKEITGIPWRQFCKDLEKLIEGAEKSDSSYEYIEDSDYPEFVKSVARFARQSNLIVDDLLHLDHWGIAADGKIVLLDSGYSHNLPLYEVPED